MAKTRRDNTRVVVDAMGGDFAPDVNIRGALQALEQDTALTVVLVGQKEILLEKLSLLKVKPSERLEVLHADDVITMEDHPSTAIRRKKNSSIHIGLEEVKSGRADAFVSAGSSGAVMAGSLLILGRISNIERPAILIKFPTVTHPVVLLDAGANVDCKPIHLFQFAEMGRLYVSLIEGRKKPKIGLLSNGSEESKGNELTRETHQLLKASKMENYIGYIEGYDIFKATADVVVCDGFVGNVSLKLAEGLAETAFHWLRGRIKGDVLGLLGVALLRNIVKKFKQKFDYQHYGAAPLLGINGLVLISHGKSSDVAISNAILMARKAAQQNFTDTIKTHMEAQASQLEKAQSSEKPA